MNKIWYEVKVKFRQTTDTGSQKIVTLPYLFDAISYTECEARLNKELPAYISEEFKVSNIRTANYAEIHHFDNADRWFKSKITLFAFDEETGKERKTNMYLLVQANDVESAYINTINAMKNTMGEYSIPSISETPIMDVFPYFSSES